MITLNNLDKYHNPNRPLNIKFNGQSAVRYCYRGGGEVIALAMPIGLAVMHASAMRKAIRDGKTSYRMKYWSREIDIHHIDPGSIRVIRNPMGKLPKNTVSTK